MVNTPACFSPMPSGCRMRHERECRRSFAGTLRSCGAGQRVKPSAQQALCGAQLRCPGPRHSTHASHGVHSGMMTIRDAAASATQARFQVAALRRARAGPTAVKTLSTRSGERYRTASQWFGRARRFRMALRCTDRDSCGHAGGASARRRSTHALETLSHLAAACRTASLRVRRV
jgi:hypothetical protein